jgi:hypothetical protein
MTCCYKSRNEAANPLRYDRDFWIVTIGVLAALILVAWIVGKIPQ